jgi:plastocyanin
VGCDVSVTNPTGDVLAVEVEVDGPAAEWAVVLPPALLLAPGASGRARITFAVPDGEHPSTRHFTVRVRGAEAGEAAGRIEIGEVRDLRISIRPMVARGRRATTHTVTVENRGTRPSRAALVAGETSGDVALRMDEERVTVAPGGQAAVMLRVTPRGRVFTARPRPYPFTVEARPESGPPVSAEATRFQDPVRWRTGAIAVALVVAVASAGALVLRSGRTSIDGRRPGAATAPSTSVALASTCPAGGTAGPLGLDIAGFAYCPATHTVAVGAEVVWTNADLAPHTVTYDGPDGMVDSGSMAQGQSWSTRFEHAGTYRYYCRFHPGMSATIVVDPGR